MLDKAMDPIEAMIRDSGWLQDPDLWRQWIFTQMLRACQARDPEAFRARFFNARPYAYQWDVAVRELKIHVKARPSESATRPMFFELPVIDRMLSDYIAALDVFAANPKRQRRDSNGAYVSIKGERIYLASVSDCKSFAAYKKLARKTLDRTRRARKAGSYRLALKAVEDFKSTALMPPALPKSEAWMDAFTGNGAYYTMDNLVRFYGCQFTGKNGTPLSLDDSLKKLASSACTLNRTPEAMFDLMSMLLDMNPEARNSLFENQESEVAC